MEENKIVELWKKFGDKDYKPDKKKTTTATDSIREEYVKDSL